jgi:hypothetical protein
MKLGQLLTALLLRPIFKGNSKAESKESRSVADQPIDSESVEIREDSAPSCSRNVVPKAQCLDASRKELVGEIAADSHSAEATVYTDPDARDEAQLARGKEKLFGSGAMPKDLLGAHSLLLEAAKREVVAAQSLLASAYWNGWFWARYEEDALHWGRKAAKKGDVSAAELVRIIESRRAAPKTQVELTAEESAPVSLPRQGRSRIDELAERLVEKARKQPRSDRSFEFARTVPIEESIDLRLFLLGARKAAKCEAEAEEALPRAIRDEPDVTVGELARRLASQRGLLEIDVAEGMDGLVDGADVFFDQRRAAFIAGVEAWLADHEIDD